MRAAQVLTCAPGDGPANSAEDQDYPLSDDALREGAASSLVMRERSTPASDQPTNESLGHDQGSATVPDHGGRRSGSKKTKKRRRKKRSGGWPPSSGLKWRRDVRVIDDIAYQLASTKYALTHFVTIMPYDGDALTRKRTCSRVVAHLGQALKRRGHRHVGLTIIEHPLQADLHGHHLVCVARSEHARFENWRTCKADIDVRRITDIRGLLRYLLKQRQRLPPDFEARIRATKGPGWQKCRPVPGKRWSMTTDAKVVLMTGAWPAPLPKPSIRHAKQSRKPRK